ncbi:MAG: transcription antitermination factor NusB [Clostridia bacterium]|nr:transcription antitermination factor NusB [Clostridia bacterium]MBQ2191354.1 transcription antitermination factor NusB [Clostridia bacterium]MBQ3937774.1 transcription antitermination factor NusB [Clostridia bacterium]MBQ5487602.1 transcription antitermination factor NusB [Clostridia bacterium]MBR4636950.1 transcription antitermination factor NusB [Clostridia bacterium]
MSRKIAREVAMKLTYEKMFGCDETYHEVLEQSGIEDEPSEADIAFANDIVSGVQQNLAEIDEIIQSAAVGWTVNRMPKVDLSILRNAVYEIRFGNSVPAAVAVNEAVELAKTYCDEHSPKFINGLLGKVVRG